MKSNNSKLCRIALLAGLMTVSSHGATLLTQVSAPTRNNFTSTVGVRFTVANTTPGVDNLLVTSLGFQDAGLDGLTTTHQVGLWRVSDGFLMASVTVPAGTGGTLVGDYRYAADFAGVTLLEGVTYAIGGRVVSGDGDAWTDVHPAAGMTMNSAATVAAIGDVYSGVNGGFAHMTADGGGNNLRWGPGNMQFTVVPEPSAALLGGLGLLGLLRRRRN